MIDIKDIVVQNTTECKCGHQFTLKDYQKLEEFQDAHGFYANNVKHYSHSQCPKCKRKVLLLLKQKGQTWEIINTATEKSHENERTIAENYHKKQTTFENKTENDNTQELICPICGKVCKSKLGYNAHMKSHQN